MCPSLPGARTDAHAGPQAEGYEGIRVALLVSCRVQEALWPARGTGICTVVNQASVSQGKQRK